MTDLTDRAAAVDAIIAERPSTITAYYRSGSGEGERTPFTGRIDEMGTTARNLAPQHEGTVAVITYLLLCPQDSRVVQSKDTIEAVDEAGGTSWYRVISTRDFGYKQECVLVARDDV